MPKAASVLFRHDVRSGWSLRTLLDFIADTLTFGQSLEARSRNGAEMHKQIITTLFRGNKSEALGLIEPLNSTCSHYT